MKKIEVFGLETVPEIKAGDNLAEIIINCATSEIGGLREKDIVVLTSKIVSKAVGRVRKLSEVKPGKRALAISKRTGKDAKWLQMIFDEGHDILAVVPLTGFIEQNILSACGEDQYCSRQLIKHERAICITKGKDGQIHTCDAGIDGSNHPSGIVSLLPEYPDKAAQEIREQVRKLTGKQVAVILADTEIVPFGTMDLAIGSSGIEPRTKMFGKKDLFGNPKFGGIDLTAHELTAASALVFGQTRAGVAVAVIRNFQYELCETENISNSIRRSVGSTEVSKTIRATIRATAYTRGLKQRLLLRIASWFVS